MAQRHFENQQQRVLFIDDEAFISGTLAQHLRILGWDVTFVSDINELFKEIRKSQKFDILIFDIMMPIPEMENKYVVFSQREIEEMDGGMNTGVVLAKKIWTEVKNDIPILFLSAKRPESVSQLPTSFRFDYIRKPVLAETLEIKLKVMLNHKSPRL